MNLVTPVRDFIGTLQRAVREQSISQSLQSIWSNQPLALKVTAAAVPLLFILGTAALFSRRRYFTREAPLLEPTPPLEPTQLLQRFKNERWFSAISPLVDERRILPRDIDSGKLYKFLRKAEYPKLINIGLWTDAANIDLADRSISMLYVCADAALRDIEAASGYRTDYLNSQTHYTGIFLFDFLDFYRRAEKGLKTVTTPQGDEALVRDKGFDPVNFSTAGTTEYQWKSWQKEILTRLRTLFLDRQLQASCLQKLMGE